MTVRYSGPMRLFFNKHGAAPLMWCVSTDSWELAVKSLTVLGATVTSVYAPKPTPDDEDGKPSAWLEVEGELVVVHGNATVYLPDSKRIDVSDQPLPAPIKCECRYGTHSDRPCTSNAWATVLRDGKRVAVCDRCDFTTDTDTVPLPEVSR